MEGMKPPLYRWQGSLFRRVGVFHIREERGIVIPLDMGVLIHFTPSICLVLPTMTQFSEWFHSMWGSLSASINGH